MPTQVPVMCVVCGVSHVTCVVWVGGATVLTMVCRRWALCVVMCERSATRNTRRNVRQNSRRIVVMPSSLGVHPSTCDVCVCVCVVCGVSCAVCVCGEIHGETYGPNSREIIGGAFVAWCPPKYL